MNRRVLSVTFFLASLIPAWGQNSKPAAADLIIRNAKIWTVDRDHPEAEAVALLGDRIVAVGSNQEIDVWRGPNTRVQDAAGKRLLPGFNDAHVHFTPCRGARQEDNQR